jgi:hypothetical protein
VGPGPIQSSDPPSGAASPDHSERDPDREPEHVRFIIKFLINNAISGLRWARAQFRAQIRPPGRCPPDFNPRRSKGRQYRAISAPSHGSATTWPSGARARRKGAKATTVDVGAKKRWSPPDARLVDDGENDVEPSDFNADALAAGLAGTKARGSDAARGTETGIVARAEWRPNDTPRDAARRSRAGGVPGDSRRR